MADLAARWAPPPDRSRPLVDRQGLRVTWIEDLSQTIVSGDLPAAKQALAPGLPDVGLWGLAAAEGAWLRLARDRALLVRPAACAPAAPVPGWHAAGYAVTPADDAWAVLELVGGDVAAVVSQGAAIETAAAEASPCAAVLFAGCWCLLYRTEGERIRLHVEQPFAAYLSAWLKKAAAA